MSTTRRDFLELIGVISAGFLIAPSVFANTTSGKKRQLLASSKDSVFFLTDILSGKTETFQVTAPGHDMYHHPFDSDLVLIVPKRTNKISVFSLSKKKEVATIASCDDQHAFYGHIAFHPKKNIFYSTQVNMKTWDGKIVIYDGKTYKRGEQFGDYAGRNHDLRMLNDQSLVVSMTGVRFKQLRSAPSGLHVFDTETLKLKHTYAIQDEMQQASHICVLANNEIITYCNPSEVLADPKKVKYGSVYSNLGKESVKDLVEWPIPEEYKYQFSSEFLAYAFHQDGKTLAVTNPVAKKTFFFDTEKRTFQKIEDHPEAGVAFYNNSFQFFPANGHGKILDIG